MWLRRELEPYRSRGAQTMIASVKQRLHELDSVRGLAAFSVVLGHFFHIFPAAGPYAGVHRLEMALRNTPLFAAFAGDAAVIVFYVLSGFVLCLPMLDGRRVDYGHYMARRFLRIYPAYLVAVLMSLTFAVLCYRGPLQGLSEWANSPWSAPPTWEAMFDHLLLIGSFQNARFNPVFWSLVHEMRISLIYPFLVSALLRRDWKTVLMAALVTSAIGTLLNKTLGSGTDYFITVHYAGMFIVGFLLARHRTEICRYFQAARAMLVSVALIGLLVYVYSRYAVLNVLRDWASTVGGAVFIIVALCSTRVSRFLNLAPLHFLGRVSYSLYLFHAAILLAGLHLFYGRISIGIIIGAALLVGVACATLSYHVIELPGVRAGRNFFAAPNVMVRSG